MKPSDPEVRTYIRKCPYDNRSGWLEWYLPEDRNDRTHLQLAVNHGLGNRFRRNDFHYVLIFRDALPGEIQQSYRAYPEIAPEASLIS